MPQIYARGELPKAPPPEPQDAHQDAPRQADMVEQPAALEQPEQTEALSPKFAALARQEQKLRALDRQIKEREAKLLEREKSYETSYVPKERLTKETLAVLEEAGLTRNQIAEMLLNEGGQAQDPTASLKAEIDALKAAIEAQKTETKSELEGRDKRAREQAVNQLRVQVKGLVEQDPQFETIKESGASEAVVKFIEQTFDEEGVLLDVEEAARFIEEQMVDEAMKAMQLKKVQERVRAQFEPKQQQPPMKQQPQTMKTLTQALVSPSQPMTAQEKRRRAILRAQGIDPDAAR